MTLRAAGIITLILTIVAAGAWWFTLRDKQLATIDQLTSDEQNAAVQANMRRTREAEAQQQLLPTQQQLMRQHTRLTNYERLIPDEIEFTPLMLLINNLTDHHALRHDGITETSREQETSSIYSVTYDLITSGAFEDQMLFIAELQNQPRLMAVRSVQMNSRATQSNNEPIITLTMQLQTFTRGALPDPDEENKE